MAKRFAGEDAGGQIRDIENVPTSVLFERQQDLARKPLNTEDGASETIMRGELENRGVSAASRIPSGVLVRQFKAECARTGDPRKAWRALCERHGFGNVAPPAEIRRMAGMRPVAANDYSKGTVVYVHNMEGGSPAQAQVVSDNGDTVTVVFIGGSNDKMTVDKSTLEPQGAEWQGALDQGWGGYRGAARTAGMGTYDDPAEDPRSPEEAGALASRRTAWDAPVAKTKITKNDYGEYQVKAYDADGNRLENSDYFTDDKADAEATADAMVKKSSRRMAGWDGETRYSDVPINVGDQYHLYNESQPPFKRILTVVAVDPFTGTDADTVTCTDEPEDESGSSGAEVYDRGYLEDRIHEGIWVKFSGGFSNAGMYASRTHTATRLVAEVRDEVDWNVSNVNIRKSSRHKEAGVYEPWLDDLPEMRMFDNDTNFDPDADSVAVCELCGAPNATLDEDTGEYVCSNCRQQGAEIPAVASRRTVAATAWFSGSDFSSQREPVCDRCKGRVDIDASNPYLSTEVPDGTECSICGVEIGGDSARQGSRRTAGDYGPYTGVASCPTCGKECTEEDGQSGVYFCEDCANSQAGGPWFPGPKQGDQAQTASRREGWGSSYSRDPFWLTTKYSGECKQCHRPIARGEKAFYYPIGKRLLCDGPCGQAASADFEMGKADEDFMNRAGSRKTADGEYSAGSWAEQQMYGAGRDAAKQGRPMDEAMDSMRAYLETKALKKAFTIGYQAGMQETGDGSMAGTTLNYTGSRTATGEPVGYAFDIGGGVAYACPECKASTPRDDEDYPAPGDFWRLDSYELNGTERCEQCGKSLSGDDVEASRKTAAGEPSVEEDCPVCGAPLEHDVNGSDMCPQCGYDNGDDGPGGGVEASRKTAGGTTLDEAERMAVQGSESGEQPWLILQDMSNPDSYYACSWDDWSANKDSSLAGFGIYDSLMNGMSVNRTDHPANGWLRSRNAASQPADPLADKWAHGNGRNCLQSGGDSGTATASYGDPEDGSAEDAIPADSPMAPYDPDDYLPSQDVAPDCPTCGGPGEELGGLGNLMHYRCRDCGMDFSQSAATASRRTAGTTLDLATNSAIVRSAETGEPFVVLDDPDTGGYRVARLEVWELQKNAALETCRFVAAYKNGAEMQRAAGRKTAEYDLDNLPAWEDRILDSAHRLGFGIDPMTDGIHVTDRDGNELGVVQGNYGNPEVNKQVAQLLEAPLKKYMGISSASRREAYTPSYQDDDLMSDRMDADIMQNDFENAGRNLDRRYKKFKQLIQAGDVSGAASICPHLAGYPLDSVAASNSNDPQQGQSGWRCTDCGSRVEPGYGEDRAVLVPCEIKGRWASRRTADKFDGLHSSDFQTPRGQRWLVYNDGDGWKVDDTAQYGQSIQSFDSEREALDYADYYNKTLNNDDWVKASRTAANTMSFEDWMAKVDKACEATAYLSTADLADCPYRDWYDDGVKPESAAKRAIKRDGGGVEGARTAATGEFADFGTWKGLVLDCVRDSGGNATLIEQYSDGELEDWYESGMGVQEAADKITEDDYGYEASRTAGQFEVDPANVAYATFDQIASYAGDPLCPECGASGQFVQGTDQILNCPSCGQVRMPLTEEQKTQHDWLDPIIEEQKNFKWSGEPMIPEGGWHA